MNENAKKYKKISLKILETLENGEISNLDGLLDERQSILEIEKDTATFKKELICNEIISIDNRIHTLLSESIDDVKQQLREHRLSKQANNSYMNFSKEKLNIFNKKV